MGISAIRRFVAPNGMRVMGVRGFVDFTGDMGGASAALWATVQESSTLPCADNGSQSVSAKPGINRNHLQCFISWLSVCKCKIEKPLIR